MSKQTTKFASQPLAQVLEGIELGERAAGQLQPADDASALFARLASAGLHVEALKVAAAALPKREAVWMAARCVQELHGAGAPAVQSAALEAARAWAQDPSDANRRAASAASEKAGLDQAFGCVAIAAFLSEGSLGPPDVPPIPPAAHLCGLSVGLGIEIALAGLPPAQRACAGARCVAIARELAEQPAAWDSAAKTSPANAPASTSAPTAAPHRPAKR
jgi:hypothetical protein